MSEKPFDASRHLTNLEGKGVSGGEVAAALTPKRAPEVAVSTELMKHESGLALFRARVSLPEGGEATGWGSETVSDVRAHIEAAETKAVGCALAVLILQTLKPSKYSADASASDQAPRPMSGTKRHSPSFWTIVPRGSLVT
jgi:hypothetical protein